jgi:hypothetical protein
VTEKNSTATKSEAEFRRAISQICNDWLTNKIRICNSKFWIHSGKRSFCIRIELQGVTLVNIGKESGRGTSLFNAIGK